MKSRLDFAAVSPDAFETMLNLGSYLAGSERDASLRHLMSLRAPQVNDSAYCFDLHWTIWRALGETEQRLQALDAWDESTFYSERERTVLAWTEAVTQIADGHVPDEVYATARAQFGKKKLVDMTLAVAAINGWNRLSVAFRSQPGEYYSRVACARKHAGASL